MKTRLVNQAMGPNYIMRCIGLQIKYAGCKRMEVRKQMAGSVEERLKNMPRCRFLSVSRGKMISGRTDLFVPNDGVFQ